MESLLTSHQAGHLLQVDRSSINNWVKAGHIPAFRTPGGHLRIKVADLVCFCENQQIPLPEPLSGMARRRMLVVDDDEQQLRALRRVLKPYADKVELTTVDNGIDALVLVGAVKPHLIVIDVFMPGVDGIEVCRKLKQNPRTRDTEIIIASGQLTADVEREAMEAGASRCMYKPLAHKTLLAALGVSEEGAR